MKEQLFKLTKDGVCVGYEQVSIWEIPGTDEETLIWVYSKDGKGWSEKRIPHDEKHPFVTLDKHGEKVFAGDKISYIDLLSDEWIFDKKNAPKAIGRVNWIEHKRAFMPQEIKENHKGGHYIAHWDSIKDIELIS